MDNHIIYVDPGAKLWYVIRGPGYWSRNYRGDIIVPVIAKEVHDIYNYPDGGSIWRCRLIDGTDYIDVPSGQQNEHGWPIYERKDPSWLGDSQPINQFVWIDEPIGHALQVDNCELFLTLQEAQKCAMPSRKKHLKRRLRQHRAARQESIANTWGRYNHPGFKKLPDKKVYVAGR